MSPGGGAPGGAARNERDLPALQRCIAIDSGAFAEEYWSRRPLLSQAADLGRPFDDLLTLASVDELLSKRSLRTPFVRMVKDGSVIDTSRFARGGGAGAEIGDQVADDEVARLFEDGATIVLQALHRTWPPIADFARGLAVELGHPVQVNAYVTPPSSRGFEVHYDVHDVFVLQVAGEKRWLVWEPVHEAPLRDQPWTVHRARVEEAARDEPLLDATLAPGDCLYLPRGYLHAAEALGDVSAHLTVGIHTVTRHDLAEILLRLAADDPALRTSLPLGLDAADPADVEAELAATVEALTERLHATPPGTVAEQLRRRVWRASRPGPVEPLRQAAALAAVDSTTAVRLRPALRARLERTGDGVLLQLPDRAVPLPQGTEDAVGALLAGGTESAGTLPGLDEQQAVELVALLLREAVLVPAA